MIPEVFLSEQHPTSKRTVVLEDDGLSAWLYLTDKGSDEIIADCWLYNRVSSPEPVESYVSKGIAPPAPSGVTSEHACICPSDPSEFHLSWAGDGDAVAVFFRGLLMGFTAAVSKRGYSRNLAKACSWGVPLDEALYCSIFGTSEQKG